MGLWNENMKNNIIKLNGSVRVLKRFQMKLKKNIRLYGKYQ